MEKKYILIAIAIVATAYAGTYAITLSVPNTNPTSHPTLQLPQNTEVSKVNLSKIHPIDPEISIREGKSVPQAQGDVVIVFPRGTSTLEPKQMPFPGKLLVTQGDTVTWNNLDTVDHTVTSGYSGQGESIGRIFDSGIIASGQSFSYTFSEERLDGYHYFCSIHPWEKGEIIVQRLEN